jgi:ribosome-associated toxin RatA of RatAB toxin-antitoxin module
VLGKVLSPLFDGMADSMVEAFVRRAREVKRA